MVHITEMRILLPLTVEEYKRGQRYGNWKTNVDNTQEGQGGTLLSSSPYFHEVYGKGVFTHTIYRLGNRLPDWVTRMVPANALIVEEKSWMTYPYFKSILTIPFFSKLKIEIVSVHVDDDGSNPNVLDLSPSELAIRKIDMVDIGADPVGKNDYKKHLDPSLVRPTKLQRGPLTEGWQKREKPLMCAYKIVRAEANYWGVAGRAEKLMINCMRQIFLLAHKNCFCYADEWYDMTYDEVMDLERKNRDLLKELAKRKPTPAEGSEEASNEGADETDPAVTPARPVTANGVTSTPTSTSRDVDGAHETKDDVANGDVGEGDEKLRSDDSDSDESMGVEFFEAEMEWALQEELAAEDAFSGLGSRGGSLDDQSAPASCPVCEVARRKQPPTMYCEDCQEFFCSTCFPEFHTTPRLRLHRRLPLSPRPSPAGTTSAGLGGFFGLFQPKPDSQSSLSSDEKTAVSPSGKEGTEKEKLDKGSKKESQLKKSQSRDNWASEFQLTPEETNLRYTSAPSGHFAAPSDGPVKGGKGTKRSTENHPPLNLPGVENVAGSGVVLPVVEGFHSTERDANEASFAERPVELSQEMVRSISAIYKRMGGLEPPLRAPDPTPSKLGGMAALPTVEIIAENLAQSVARSEPIFESHREEKLHGDPYGVHRHESDVDVGPYTKMMELTSMKGSKETLALDAAAFHRFKRLAEQLVEVDASTLNHEERAAFWINIYNAIVMHAYLAYGVPRTHYKRVMLMQKAAYVIGGLVFRILAIEHNVLRSMSHHPVLTAVLPLQRYKPTDLRQACVLTRPEPLISFALSCGARSAPAVRVYSAAHVHEELEAAAREYLQAAVGLSKSQKVLIPKILQWYGKDFADDTRGLLHWIADRLPVNEKNRLLDHFVKKTKSANKITHVVAYDWGFRYLFAPPCMA